MNTYEQWLRRFLRFHRLRHPHEMGPAEVNALLTHLAVDLQVSASGQNQVLAALLFLYRDLLGRDLERERGHPVENTQVPSCCDDRGRSASRVGATRWVEALIAGMLYGGGLRLMEGLRLRMHDLDFDRWQISVRGGKGGNDRRTIFPSRLGEKMRLHLAEVKKRHRLDLADGFGRVRLPHALSRKYPHAPVEWGWQWIFPQQQRWRNPSTGEQGRQNLDASVMQKPCEKQ